jgi:RimJ/RimL family protein N-acetyltransferase
MSARIRHLRDDEYDAWRRLSRERYVEDMVENGGFAPEDAREKSEKDFALTMPAGLATAGQHVFAIEAPDGEVVGHVWLGERNTRDEGRVAFVYEIRIDERQRGHGYGRAAMLLLEDEARGLGLDRIELNVFGGNEVARGLYRSLGYEERAVMMGKRLA